MRVVKRLVSVVAGMLNAHDPSVFENHHVQETVRAEVVSPFVDVYRPCYRPKDLPYRIEDLDLSFFYPGLLERRLAALIDDVKLEISLGHEFPAAAKILGVCDDREAQRHPHEEREKDSLLQGPPLAACCGRVSRSWTARRFTSALPRAADRRPRCSNHVMG